jgi:uncharacterized protein YodC (DUF2158 family)
MDRRAREIGMLRQHISAMVCIVAPLVGVVPAQASRLSTANAPPLNEPVATHDVFRRPQVGDFVRVRSGGPVMTVEGVDGDQTKCAWSENGELVSGIFPVHLLMIAAFTGWPAPSR